MMQLAAPSLPPMALYPATAALFLTLLFAMSRTPHLSGKYLIAIIWVRYVMQAFHEVTFQPLVGAFSANAVVSAVVIAGGVFVIAPRIGAVVRMPFILLLVGLVVLSGVLNSAYEGLIDNLLKWGYFLVIVMCAYDCMMRDRGAAILRTLIWAFAPALLYQALSLVLNVGKMSEDDGSVSFIGGFYHEAAFSIVLATCFMVASFARGLNGVARAALLLTCIAGIILANYRTTIIAIAPTALGYFLFSATQAVRPRQRLFIGAAALALAVCAIVGASWLLRERFADLAAATESAGSLIKPPGEFSQAERELMSGRVYLWNSYLDAYLAGADLQLLFGFGPNAWEQVFTLYAHNTLVSYLYEFGAVGVATIMAVWLSMLIRAGHIPDPAIRGQVLFAHVGFIILNFATMPYWQIEGLIYYGLLCGYTLYMAPFAPHRRAAILIAAARISHVQSGRR